MSEDSKDIKIYNNLNNKIDKIDKQNKIKTDTNSNKLDIDNKTNIINKNYNNDRFNTKIEENYIEENYKELNNIEENNKDIPNELNKVSKTIKNNKKISSIAHPKNIPEINNNLNIPTKNKSIEEEKVSNIGNNILPHKITDEKNFNTKKIVETNNTEKILHDNSEMSKTKGNDKNLKESNGTKILESNKKISGVEDNEINGKNVDNNLREINKDTLDNNNLKKLKTSNTEINKDTKINKDISDNKIIIDNKNNNLSALKKLKKNKTTVNSGINKKSKINTKPISTNSNLNNSDGLKEKPKIKQKNTEKTSQPITDEYKEALKKLTELQKKAEERTKIKILLDEPITIFPDAPQFFTVLQPPKETKRVRRAEESDEGDLIDDLIDDEYMSDEMMPVRVDYDVNDFKVFEGKVDLSRKFNKKYNQSYSENMMRHYFLLNFNNNNENIKDEHYFRFIGNCIVVFTPDKEFLDKFLKSKNLPYTEGKDIKDAINFYELKLHQLLSVLGIKENNFFNQLDRNDFDPQNYRIKPYPSKKFESLQGNKFFKILILTLIELVVEYSAINSFSMDKTYSNCVTVKINASKNILGLLFEEQTIKNFKRKLSGFKYDKDSYKCLDEVIEGYKKNINV